MITKKINEVIKNFDFIPVATCDLEGRPNVAPKLFLKAESGHIYLIDYVIGRTLQNLELNPRVSLEVTDPETLTGYQINGSVEVLSEGLLYDKLVYEFQRKEISLSSKRIIEGLHKGERHVNFEAAFPNKVVIFKVKINETVEIKASGELERETL